MVFVAHNARSFDVPFLVNEFRRCGWEIPSNWSFLDTLPLGRQVIKSAGAIFFPPSSFLFLGWDFVTEVFSLSSGVKTGGKASLQGLREYYGIESKGSAHRAMADVHILSLVLQRLTIDLELPKAGLVQKTFTANELTSSNAKKKKDSS